MARKYLEGESGVDDSEGPAAPPYDVALRRMREGDVDRVLQIEYVSFTMPWSSLTYRNLLKRRDAEVWVADNAEDGVVGYAGFWGVLDEAELGTIAVEPRRRGRGVSRRLLDRIIERVAERGMKAVFLEVRVSNAVARRLYASYGFRQVGTRRNYYAFPLEDALVLRRTVP